MKWLMLLVLIACGNNQKAAKQDLTDSDNDNIRDVDELRSGSNKLINDQEPLGDISLTLETNAKTNLQIEVSNHVRSKDFIFMAATKPTLTSLPDTIGLQRMGMMSITGDLASDQERYTFFISTKELPAKDIFMRLGSQDVQLATGTKIDLSRYELSLLREKKIYPIFYKKSDLEYPNKASTYKVFFADDESSTISIVSQQLSIDDYLRRKNLDQPREIPVKKLFFMRDNSQVYTWMRKVGADYFVLKTSLSFLKKSYMDNFSYSEQEVRRVNGEGPESLVLSSLKRGLMIASLKGHYTKRKFSESKAKNTLEEDKIFTSSAVDQPPVTVNSANFLEELRVLVDGKDFSSSSLKEEYIIKSDSIVFFVPPSATQFEVHLPILSETDFHLTNANVSRYWPTPSWLQPPQRLHEEAEFIVNSKTYVENDWL